MKAHVLFLDTNWQWSERDTEVEPLFQASDKYQIKEQTHSKSDAEARSIAGIWRQCAIFPSEIHRELMSAGLIPDPYLGSNEHRVQWVGEREWLYRTTFEYSNSNEFADLIFKGLDTLCTVYLNGKEILDASNQFTPYTVSLDPTLLHQGTNNLLLHFKSAKKAALALEEKYGAVRAGSVNLGHPSRVYVRKAQYDWRWDWGPELMTVGPYLPILLRTYDVTIDNIYPRTFVSLETPHDGHEPRITLKLRVSLAGAKNKVYSIRVELTPRSSGDNDAPVIRSETIEAASILDREGSETVAGDLDVCEWTFEKGKVKLWWPVGYGDASLYTVSVSLIDKDSHILEQQNQTFGFRTVELVQQPYDSALGDHTALDRYHHGQGTSFYFRINDVPIFMGGSNWIPADNFFTTIGPERYRAWLQLLKDGNQNMIRVWGGGIYEVDDFYDICDELGILVWQDFQFACGVYPAHEEFVASVKQEAEGNVLRLRHHPSIVLWCGNNEDYQQVLQWGGIDELPARVLYEHVLPDVVRRLTDPAVPYHRGSPYGGKGWDTSDPTIGDIHQWQIWAGNEPYWQNYDSLGGRFVSEFGIPAFPSQSTIEYWLEDGLTSEAEKQKLRYAQSKSMQQHNKAGSHERRFAVLMSENFRYTSNFDEHIYNTQLLQSEALGYAYRVWRREWRGAGREYCAGALVWQLNDCWPVISWSIADYFLRPKPGYFAIKRELAPITLGIKRTVHKNRPDDRPKQFYEFGAFQSSHATLEIWATNATLRPIRARLEIQFHDLHSDWTTIYPGSQYDLTPNSSSELIAGFPVPSPPLSVVPSATGEHDERPDPDHSFSVVVSARLYSVGNFESGDSLPLEETPNTVNTILARTTDWPQPYRLLDLPSSDEPALLDISFSHLFNDAGTIVMRLDARRPVKCVVLSLVPVDGWSASGAVNDEEEDVKWSDNGVDAVPSEPIEIRASVSSAEAWGAMKGKKKLEARFLGGVLYVDLKIA